MSATTSGDYSGEQLFCLSLVVRRGDCGYDYSEDALGDVELSLPPPYGRSLGDGTLLGSPGLEAPDFDEPDSPGPTGVLPVGALCTP